MGRTAGSVQHMEAAAAEIRAAVLGLAVKRVLDQTLLTLMNLRNVDRSEAGQLARQIGHAFRSYGLSLWPRVHVAVQLNSVLHELRVAFIKVRTGESVVLSDAIAICEPGLCQARIDKMLDEQVGQQPVRWCTCGHEDKPEAGHEEDCPLAPFEVSGRHAGH